MICEKCQERPATVLITKIINGKKTESRLCEICAQQENAFTVQLDPKMVLQNFFADFFNSYHQGLESVKVSRDSGEKCEQCGFTDANFAKTGKLGCSECYHFFGDKLDPLLRRIHGTSRHTGKIPQRAGGNLKIRQQIEDLKNQLQQAVNQEEYEKAARLRDEIRGLENQAKGGQKDDN